MTTAAEKKQQLEAVRAARAREEEARQREEERRQEEEERLLLELEEAERREEEERRRAEEEAERAAEEKKRAEEEARRAEEARRVAEEKRRTEAARSTGTGTIKVAGTWEQRAEAAAAGSSRIAEKAAPCYHCRQRKGACVRL
jgi:membrane protein involved in colicin uptake